MKKKIVIVDDRPWKMKESIQQLQNDNIVFYKSIYYPNNMLNKARQNQLMEDYKKETHVEVIQVNSQKEFIAEMDKLYGDPTVVFFMDYDLKGDINQDDFFSKVNVKYALEKDKDKKIWFHSSGSRDIQGLLQDTFPDRVISVPRFSEGQLYLDEKQVKEIVKE